MRSYLHVDTDAGLCRFLPLPPELEVCGGRALASLLASRKSGRLCMAPGLLTGCRCASAGRCAVSCSQNDGRVLHSNAGGSVGPIMAETGLAALVIEGGERGALEKRPLYDLVVAPGEAYLCPSSLRGQRVPSAMQMLASRYPEAAALITVGPAAERGLPMASLAFSDHRFRASSHAGSGSGSLLCKAGLRSVIFLKGARKSDEDPKLTEATRRFVEALKQARGGIPVSSRGCTSNCVLDCHKSDVSAPSPAKKGAKSMWPGFQEFWSCGDADADAGYVRRFVELCNELGVDAFALGRVLGEAAEKGLVARGDAAAALEALEELERSDDAALLPPVLAWMGGGKKAGASEESIQGVIMDCLGICRFAADAVVQAPKVREVALEMVRCLHGLEADDLYLMAMAVLQAESGRGDASEKTEGGGLL